jgi:hypothetical protein
MTFFHQISWNTRIFYIFEPKMNTKNDSCHMVWMFEDLDTFCLQSIWLCGKMMKMFKNILTFWKYPKHCKTISYLCHSSKLWPILCLKDLCSRSLKLEFHPLCHEILAYKQEVRLTSNFLFSLCVCALDSCGCKQVSFVTPKICICFYMCHFFNSIVLGINIWLHKTTKWILLNFQGKLFKNNVAIVFWFKPKGK